MTEQGFKWHAATVYQVENRERQIQLPEALALARIFGTPIEAMTQPIDEEVTRLRERRRRMVVVRQTILQNLGHLRGEYTKLADTLDQPGMRDRLSDSEYQDLHAQAHPDPFFVEILHAAYQGLCLWEAGRGVDAIEDKPDDMEVRRIVDLVWQGRVVAKLDAEEKKRRRGRMQRRNRRAGVEDRWFKSSGEKSTNHGTGKSWRAKYVDEYGREHAQCFARKFDARQSLDGMTAAVITGQDIAPKADQVTFRDYATRWRKIQAHRLSTRAQRETRLRKHAHPALGDSYLSEIMPSDIQARVAGLELAPATTGVVHGIVASVMKAAVKDRRLASHPREGTKLPKKGTSRSFP